MHLTSIKHMFKFIIVFILIWIDHAEVLGQIYVSPNGNDKNKGTYTQPIASFSKAQYLAKGIKNQKVVEVIFKPGTYYLSETVQFTSSNDQQQQLIFKAEKNGTAIISGGELIHVKWRLFNDKIFVADLPSEHAIDQLFVNGHAQRMARYPNPISGKAVFDTWDLNHSPKLDSSNDVFNPNRVHTWKNPNGAYIHAMHAFLWGDMHWLITGKIKDSLISEGGWQNNRPSKMHPVYRIVENVLEELDQPGEWFYHKEEQKLYYYPDHSVDLSNCKIEIVRLKHLIELNGDSINPVKNIHFKGFVFTHTARTFMENKEPLQRSDWTVYRGGAFLFNGAVNCSIEACEFTLLGGNAIFVNKFNRNIAIKKTYIHDVGSSGILFVGDSSAVRNPLYGYVKRDYHTMDRTKGPRNANYPADCRVSDCLITHTGRVEKQTAGIHISVSANIHIDYCSIYDMPRAGININEGSFGGHIIEHSDIFNTVLETGDHGSFNSWGRDRYWTGDGKEVAHEIDQDSSLYLLDMLAPNIIRHNRWRCDFGWDIDLDDGSSHYRIYDNLLLARGLKLREGYDRIVTNNIMVNNSLHPHVWYPKSGDVFKHNIVFSAYKPALMNKIIPDKGKWGLSIDSNFFACDSTQLQKFWDNGCDRNSLSGDPLFENPSIGNFSVQSNSPALKVGFKNFTMDQFGVITPSLKAIAKTPVIPSELLDFIAKSPKRKGETYWMDAVLYEPKEDELSAFGIGFNEGGVALMKLHPDGLLLKAGFKSGDIINAINGKSIKTISNFKQVMASISSNTPAYVFEIIRNQQKIILQVNQKLNKIE